MVSVHGGGFFQGSRSFGAANLRWYADHGWTVISIDYRLARDDRPTWNLATARRANARWPGPRRTRRNCASTSTG